MADFSFPVFRDESGYVAPVAEPRPKTPPAAAEPAFQALVTQDQRASTTPAPTVSRRDTAAYHDDSGYVAPRVEEAAATGGKTAGISLFAEGDTPSLWDVLDLVNPLQHIPVVNTIYRELTGDKIGAVAKVAGGALLGGPIGLGLALANLTVEDSTGQDVGQHVLAMLRDETAPAAAETRIAQQAAPQPAEAQASAPRATAAAEPARAVLASASQEPSTTPAGTIDVQFRPVPARGAMAISAAGLKQPGAASAAAAPTSTAIEKAAAQRGIKDAAHTPLDADTAKSTVAPVAADAATSSAATATDAKNADWFVNRFTEAMDRYDQARKLAPRPDEKL